MGIKVLSLFDGISCGMVALERAGLKVDEYIAYEIDEDAIKVSKSNYPEIIQKGDVFKADFTEHDNVYLLIGGSPCTYWSIAKASGDRETTSSGFGWDYSCNMLERCMKQNLHISYMKTTRVCQMQLKRK